MSKQFHKQLWRRAVRLSPQSQAPHDSLLVLEDARECFVCGQVQMLPSVQPGYSVNCVRCGTHLARRRRTSVIGTPAAFCMTAAALYVVLLLDPLMTLNVYGRENTVSLWAGPQELAHQGYGGIALLVAFVTIIMPGVAIALMGAILYGASRKRMPDWAPCLLAWYERLRAWSMVEVYVLGVLVAYTKLVDLAVVTLQPGVYVLGALMLTMATLDSTFDDELIWNNRTLRETVDGQCGRLFDVAHADRRCDVLPPSSHVVSCTCCSLVMAFDHPVDPQADLGDCPRCGQILRRRKKNGFVAAMSFLLAGITLYIPANLLPVMTYSKVGSGNPSTIMSGVIELWQADMIPLALLVLFASITVPVLKILALASMLVATRLRVRKPLVWLGKLYRAVEIIGRWSMIDVFMISILCAVVRFGFMANVHAELGMVCFALVVVLTIFAAERFDPRGMWDAAGLNDVAPNVHEHERRVREDVAACAVTERRAQVEAPISKGQPPGHDDMEPEHA
nr:paraquat-inducible protein A [uncultured Neokomagataea sp.]